MSARTEFRPWHSRRIDDNLLRQAVHAHLSSDSETSTSAEQLEKECCDTSTDDADTDETDLQAGTESSTTSEEMNTKDRITCSVCGCKVEELSIKEHRLACKGKKKKTTLVKCHFCQNVYRYKPNLYRHIRNHHIGKPNVAKSGKVWKKNKALKKYVEETLPFRCKICGLLYSSEQSFKLHMNKMHPSGSQFRYVLKLRNPKKKLLSCRCKFSVKKSKVKPVEKKSVVQSSVASGSGPSSQKKRCTSAATEAKMKEESPGMSSSHSSEMFSQSLSKGDTLLEKTKNMAKEKELPITEMENGKSLKCQLCDKVFFTRPGIVYHLNITHLYCSVCARQFSYDKSYHKHMRIKHNQTDVVYDDNTDLGLSAQGEAESPMSTASPSMTSASPSAGTGSSEKSGKSVSTPIGQNTSTSVKSSGIYFSNVGEDVKIPEGVFLSPVKIKLDRLSCDTNELQNFSASRKCVMVSDYHQQTDTKNTRSDQETRIHEKSNTVNKQDVSSRKTNVKPKCIPEIGLTLKDKRVHYLCVDNEVSLRETRGRSRKENQELIPENEKAVRETRKHHGGFYETRTTHKGSVSGTVTQHKGSVSGTVTQHKGSVSGTVTQHKGSVSGTVTQHKGSVSGAVTRHKGSVSKCSNQDKTRKTWTSTKEENKSAIESQSKEVTQSKVRCSISVEDIAKDNRSNASGFQSVTASADSSHLHERHGASSTEMKETAVLGVEVSDVVVMSRDRKKRLRRSVRSEEKTETFGHHTTAILTAAVENPCVDMVVKQISSVSSAEEYLCPSQSSGDSVYSQDEDGTDVSRNDEERNDVASVRSTHLFSPQTCEKAEDASDFSGTGNSNDSPAQDDDCMSSTGQSELTGSSLLDEQQFNIKPVCTTLHSRAYGCSVYTPTTTAHDIRKLLYGQTYSRCSRDLHVDPHAQSSSEHHKNLRWKSVVEEKSYDFNKLTLKITRNVTSHKRSVETRKKFFCDLAGLKLKITRDFSQTKRTVLSDLDAKVREEPKTQKPACIMHIGTSTCVNATEAQDSLDTSMETASSSNSGSYSLETSSRMLEDLESKSCKRVEKNISNKHSKTSMMKGGTRPRSHDSKCYGKATNVGIKSPKNDSESDVPSEINKRSVMSAAAISPSDRDAVNLRTESVAVLSGKSLASDKDLNTFSLKKAVDHSHLPGISREDDNHILPDRTVSESRTVPHTAAHASDRELKPLPVRATRSRFKSPIVKAGIKNVSIATERTTTNVPNTGEKNVSIATERMTRNVPNTGIKNVSIATERTTTNVPNTCDSENIQEGAKEVRERVIGAKGNVDVMERVQIGESLKSKEDEEGDQEEEEEIDVVGIHGKATGPTFETDFGENIAMAEKRQETRGKTSQRSSLNHTMSGRSPAKVASIDKHHKDTDNILTLQNESFDNLFRHVKEWGVASVVLERLDAAEVAKKISNDVEQKRIGKQGKPCPLSVKRKRQEKSRKVDPVPSLNENLMDCSAVLCSDAGHPRENEQSAVASSVACSIPPTSAHDISLEENTPTKERVAAIHFLSPTRKDGNIKQVQEIQVLSPTKSVETTKDLAPSHGIMENSSSCETQEIDREGTSQSHLDNSQTSVDGDDEVTMPSHFENSETSVDGGAEINTDCQQKGTSIAGSQIGLHLLEGVEDLNSRSNSDEVFVDNSEVELTFQDDLVFGKLKPSDDRNNNNCNVTNGHVKSKLLMEMMEIMQFADPTVFQMESSVENGNGKVKSVGIPEDMQVGIPEDMQVGIPEDMQVGLPEDMQTVKEIEKSAEVVEENSLKTRKRRRIKQIIDNMEELNTTLIAAERRNTKQIYKPKKRVKCRICGMPYVNETNLKRHVGAMHSDEIAESEELFRVVCIHIDDSPDTSEGQGIVQPSQATASEDSPGKVNKCTIFQCKICMNVYRRVGNMLKHINTCHEERTSPIEECYTVINVEKKVNCASPSKTNRKRGNTVDNVPDGYAVVSESDINPPKTEESAFAVHNLLETFGENVLQDPQPLIEDTMINISDALDFPIDQNVSFEISQESAQAMQGNPSEGVQNWSTTENIVGYVQACQTTGPIRASPDSCVAEGMQIEEMQPRSPVGQVTPEDFEDLQDIMQYDAEVTEHGLLIAEDEPNARDTTSKYLLKTTKRGRKAPKLLDEKKRKSPSKITRIRQIPEDSLKSIKNLEGTSPTYGIEMTQSSPLRAEEQTLKARGETTSECSSDVSERLVIVGSAPTAQEILGDTTPRCPSELNKRLAVVGSALTAQEILDDTTPRCPSELNKRLAVVGSAPTAQEIFDDTTPRCPSELNKRFAVVGSAPTAQESLDDTTPRCPSELTKMLVVEGSPNVQDTAPKRSSELNKRLAVVGSVPMSQEILDDATARWPSELTKSPALVDNAPMAQESLEEAMPQSCSDVTKSRVAAVEDIPRAEDDLERTKPKLAQNTTKGRTGGVEGAAKASKNFEETTQLYPPKTAKTNQQICQDAEELTGIPIHLNSFIKLVQFPVFKNKVKLPDMTLIHTGAGTTHCWKVVAVSSTVCSGDVLVPKVMEQKDIMQEKPTEIQDTTKIRDIIAQPKVDKSNVVDTRHTDIVKKTKSDKTKKSKTKKSSGKERKKIASISPSSKSSLTAFGMAISTPTYSCRKVKKRKLDQQPSSEGRPLKRSSSVQSEGSIEDKLLGDMEDGFDVCEDGVYEPFSGEDQTDSESLKMATPLKADSPKQIPSKLLVNILRKKELASKKKEMLDLPPVDLPAPFEEILAQGKKKTATTSAAPLTPTPSNGDDASSTSSESVKGVKMCPKPTKMFSSSTTGLTAKFDKSFRKASSQLSSRSSSSSQETEPQFAYRSPLERIRNETPMKFGASVQNQKTSETPAASKQSSKNCLIDMLKDLQHLFDYNDKEGPYVSPWDNPSKKSDKSPSVCNKSSVVPKKVCFDPRMKDTCKDNTVMDTADDACEADVLKGVSMELAFEDVDKDLDEDDKGDKLALTTVSKVTEGEEDLLDFAGTSAVMEEEEEEEDEGDEEYKADVESSDEEDEKEIEKSDEVDKSDEEEKEVAMEDDDDEDAGDKEIKHSDSDNDNDDDGQSDVNEEQEHVFSEPSPVKSPRKQRHYEENDILSICYDSDEADFLDDDDAKSVASRKSLTRRPASTVKISSELEEEADAVSEIGESAMDMGSVSSLVHSKIQCYVPTVLTREVLSQAAQILKRGGGHCFQFLSHGVCKRRSNCMFKHEVPPKDWFYKQGQQTIIEAYEKRNKDKAFAVYQLLKTINVELLPGLVLEKLLELAFTVWDTDSAFQLFGDLKSTNLLDNIKSSMLVRLCNSSPQMYTDQLWALFQVVLEKRLKLTGEALGIIIQAFSKRCEYAKLWVVLQYCNTVAGYIIPLQILHILLFTCMKTPKEYLPAITKWAETCSHDLLRQLEQRILVELYEICVKHNNHALGSLLKRVTATLLPENSGQVSTTMEIMEEQDWNGDIVQPSVPTSSDEYKSFQHQIRGCRISRHPEHLGSIYVGLCSELEVNNSHYVQEYVDALTDPKSPEAMVVNFELFLQGIHKELEKNKETLEDFDSPSLARIGAKLLGLCYQDEHWDTGYRLIFAMHRATVYYYKCSGQGNIGTPIMAMEICLHTHHPDSALQILEWTKGQLMTCENAVNTSRVLEMLFDKLLGTSLTKKAFSVLLILVQKLNQDQMAYEFSRLFNNLLEKSLQMGDVHTALGVYKVHQETSYGTLIVLGLRALLTACGEQRFDNKHIEEVYKSCVMHKLYPPHRFDPPRVISLSNLMTPIEMYLYISDYLHCLYNQLCDDVMEGIRLMLVDTHLCVRVCWNWNGSLAQQIDFPYLMHAAQTPAAVWQMALAVLHWDINPSLQARYCPENECIYISPESMRSYMQEKDKNGRKQGLFIQPGNTASGRGSMRGRAWARPQTFPTRGRGLGQGVGRGRGIGRGQRGGRGHPYL